MTLEIIRVAGQHMNVNSCVIRGPDGAVVVDGQLCRDDGERVRQAVAATGLPLAGVVLTHGHPDHYAAISSFASPDTPIVATHGVDAVIRRDDAVKDGIVGPMIGEQWPADRPFPNRIVDSGETVELGGVRLTVTGVGPAESHCDSYWQLDEQTIFTGDLCYSAQHAYLADGHAETWLEMLNELGRRWPASATLYPGHGTPGGMPLLEEQVRYVRTFLGAVDEHLDDAPQDREREVASALRGCVQDESLLFLALLSVEPLAATRRG
jgi:glyoxylase-like metal-dependent hydrolase (beta-lactamase superfamily II)